MLALLSLGFASLGRRSSGCVAALLGALFWGPNPGSCHAAADGQPARYLSPTTLAMSEDGRTLFIGFATANQVGLFDTASRSLRRIVPVRLPPLGLVLSRDQQRLYVTCAGPESEVAVLDARSGTELERFTAGHTAMAPVLSPDQRILYICHRFNNEVAYLDLGRGQIVQRVPVPREPVAAAVTLDGRWLLVANHLHAGRADASYVGASVTVIETSKAQVVKHLVLPNGSGLLRDIRVSPDGQLACVTHLISRYPLPTTQVDRGWINSNALTLIDLTNLEVINSILVDQVDSGAGNPWAAAWSADQQSLLVTHAGTHELSVIDRPALMAKLKALPPERSAEVPNDLAFLLDIRQRLRLSESDRGPRALAVHEHIVYLANYFTDTLSMIDLDAKAAPPESVPLGCPEPMTMARRGEFLFNDASMCFQGWQSCASCHSSDARVDGLNWDNLNDGIGNPKNVKSLLLAHRTPPAMALAVREDAEYAVRAGIRHTLFTVRPESDAAAIDEYLKSLRPISSPHLVNGQLSPAAERGKTLFFDERVGCADCHPPPLYTNLKAYDAGTSGKLDAPGSRFDTPTLIELWRTAPYLHDGRAATLRETLTHWNEADQRGKTSHLTPAEIDDLTAFLLSL